MDAQKFNEKVEDYVLGMLSSEEEVAMQNYSKKHPEANKQLEQWNELVFPIEEPSKQMDSRFHEFLDTTIKEESTTKSPEIRKSSSVIKLLPLRYGVAAAVVLLLGFLVGQQWQNPTGDNTNTIVATEALQQAEEETEAVRTQLVISLADQSSASKRLEALSEVNKLNSATDKVIAALFKMLNSDTNVNVRLAAVASLSNYVENPKVREGLVMSITKQESPLVQIALAELMVTLKEQKSINSMETLLQKPDINEAVKQKLEESIKQII